MYVLTYYDAASIVDALRSTVRELDRNVPVLEVSTLEQEVRDTLWQERLLALFGWFFGSTCLVLMGAGLYGGLVPIRGAADAGIRHQNGSGRRPKADRPRRFPADGLESGRLGWRWACRPHCCWLNPCSVCFT